MINDGKDVISDGYNASVQPLRQDRKSESAHLPIIGQRRQTRNVLNNTATTELKEMTNQLLSQESVTRPKVVLQDNEVLDYHYEKPDSEIYARITKIKNVCVTPTVKRSLKPVHAKNEKNFLPMITGTIHDDNDDDTDRHTETVESWPKLNPLR